MLGSLLLMFVMGYGISMDVENLRYAVLDRDQTPMSENYALNLSGSRYFVQQPPLPTTPSWIRRMRSGELSLAIEIPPGFARAAERRAAAMGAWLDGAMPQRAGNGQGFVQGMHQQWVMQQVQARTGITWRARASKPVIATTPM